MEDGLLRSGDGDWTEITICALASRERDFRDLGRGILCSQGFGRPPLLVGLVTMADKSNGDRSPLSITIPVAFLTVDTNQKTKPGIPPLLAEDASEAIPVLDYEEKPTPVLDYEKFIPVLSSEEIPSPVLEYATVKVEAEYKPVMHGEDAWQAKHIGVDASGALFPYAVSIWLDNKLHFCNGALISSKHVLTIASCVEKVYRRPSRVTCKIGDIHINDDERGTDAETLTASKIVMPPREQHKKAKLAIIVLETESRNDPLVLPKEGQPNRHLMRSYVRSCRRRLLQEWDRSVRFWMGADVTWPRVFTDPPARKRQLHESRDVPR